MNMSIFKRSSAWAFWMFFLVIQVSGQPKPAVQKPLSNAAITLAEKSFDFGDVLQGNVVSHTFSFQNTGTEPLMILNIQTTCGCTAPEWPKKPIPPGEKGDIIVKFNSAKKIGRINKIVTVYTNGTVPEEKLKIVANVLPPPVEPKPDANIPIQVEQPK